MGRKRKYSESQQSNHSKINEDDMVVLRRNLMSFLKLNSELNETPTLKKLKEVLRERIGFDGCEETLRSILMQSGYEWLNSDASCKALIEKHNVQMLRFTYLKQLLKYRNEGRYIVFTGESYIDTTHIQNKCLKEVTGINPVQKQVPKGMPVIIVHAGGCEGFVPNAFFMYKANSTNPDKHDSVNHNHYKNWLTNQLLPNLPKNSVIVINKVTYKNLLSVKTPNRNANKSVMQRWLKEKNLPFEETMNKLELYDLILNSIDKIQTYLIDEMIRSKGFEILQLPSYHLELNPIEKIWGILKNNVTNKKVSQNIASLMVVINEELKMIGCKEWENTCRLVEETEQQYWQHFDLDCEFIIHVDSSDSEESDSE